MKKLVLISVLSLFSFGLFSQAPCTNTTAAPCAFKARVPITNSDNQMIFDAIRSLSLVVSSFTNVAVVNTVSTQDNSNDTTNIYLKKILGKIITLITDVSGVLTVSTTNQWRKGQMDTVALLQTQLLNTIANYEAVNGTYIYRTSLNTDTLKTLFQGPGTVTITAIGSLSVAGTPTVHADNTSFSVAGTPTVHADNTSFSVAGTPTVHADNTSFSVAGTPTVHADNTSFSVAGTPTVHADNTSFSVAGTPTVHADNTSFSVAGTPTVHADNTSFSVAGTPTVHADNTSFSVAGTPTVHADNTSFSVAGTPTVHADNTSFSVAGTPTVYSLDFTKDTLYNVINRALIRLDTAIARLLTIRKSNDSLVTEIRATNVKLGQIKTNTDSTALRGQFQDVTFTVTTNFSVATTFTAGNSITSNSAATVVSPSLSLGAGNWKIVWAGVTYANQNNSPQILLCIFSSSVTQAISNTQFQMTNFGGLQGLMRFQQGVTSYQAPFVNEAYNSTSNNSTLGTLPVYLSSNVQTLYFVPLAAANFATNAANSSFVFKIRLERVH